MPVPKGFKHSDETKQKMREAHLGKVFTDTHIQNIKKAHIGVPRTDDAKISIAAGNIGKKRDTKPIPCDLYRQDGIALEPSIDVGSLSENVRPAFIRKRLEYINQHGEMECRSCGYFYPYNATYFTAAPSSLDGISRKCRRCYYTINTKKIMEKNKQRLEERLKQRKDKETK